jgi:hypothetical protein
LAPDSITSNKLTVGLVTGIHIQPQSIHGYHLKEGTIKACHLENPEMAADKGRVLQQFGMASFQFTALDEVVEVEVQLEQPYANDQYSVVAMSNHTACYTVLKEQTTQSATIQVVRTKFSPEPSGIVTWIAMGDKS